MNCVERKVPIPNYENLNPFIHFSWGSPHIAIVEEVFSSRTFYPAATNKLKENLWHNVTGNDDNSNILIATPQCPAVSS